MRHQAEYAFKSLALKLTFITLNVVIISTAAVLAAYYSH